MITLKEVDKRFPSKDQQKTITALENISLEIEQSDIFGIIGYSGAGKSTLLRIINGLEKPSGGMVQVDGQVMTELDEGSLRMMRQNIGMIFQHFHLLWSRTVRKNVAFPLEIAGFSKLEVDQRVNDLLQEVGLEDRADAYPAQLSGGQKQRVGIARALANHPKVLLCDEATSALDPETTGSILELLKAIHQERQITIVLITHEMGVVESICNKVAVLEEGRLVESGETTMIMQHPQHAATQKFVTTSKRRSFSDPPSEPIFQMRVEKTDWDGLQRLTDKYQVVIHWQKGTMAPDTQPILMFSLEGEAANVAKVKQYLLANGRVTEVTNDF